MADEAPIFYEVAAQHALLERMQQNGQLLQRYIYQQFLPQQDDCDSKDNQTESV